MDFDCVSINHVKIDILGIDLWDSTENNVHVWICVISLNFCSEVLRVKACQLANFPSLKKTELHKARIIQKNV